MIQAGKLRHRLAIQNATTTVDTHGQPLKTWTTAATVWGSIEPLRVRELFEAQQVQSRATHRVVLRHRADITAETRLLFGTRVFELEGQPRDTREIGELVELLAVEAPDG